MFLKRFLSEGGAEILDGISEEKKIQMMPTQQKISEAIKIKEAGSYKLSITGQINVKAENVTLFLDIALLLMRARKLSVATMALLL